ncbi:MAG: hypothetical protein Q9227_004899 [Pyrenula ochraceoflavens]
MALWSTWTQYFPPKPTFTENEVPSQKGRVFIVTGGNSGVGFELCKILYGTGATVYMAARSKERAEAAIESITSATPAPSTPGTLHHLPLDLNDLTSVRSAASTFSSRESKLDVLWNNAGVGALSIPQTSRTAQDTEAFMGLHCVGPLLLSKLLLPQLRTAAKSSSSSSSPSTRVVWASSILAEMSSPKPSGIDFSLLDKGLKDPIANYSSTKTGNFYLASEFARRYSSPNSSSDPTETILSIAQNPGNLNTNMFKNTPRFWMLILNLILHPPKMGAYTELYAGLSEEITVEKNGCFVIPWGRVHEWYPRKDILKGMKGEEEGGTGVARRFWEWCEGKAVGFDAPI